MIKDVLEKNKCFISFAFACILVAWGYEIFSYTISIDDELHFFDTVGKLATHSTRQGRWGGGLLNILLGNSCGIPVVPMLESLLCISCVFFILGRIMRFSSDERFLFYPLFIACPIWYYLFSFWMVSPNVGIDFLLTAVGFLGFMQRKLWVKLASLVPCAVAVGSYEISILLLPMFCSAYVLSNVVAEENAGAQDAQTDCKWQGYLELLLKMLVFMLVVVALYYGIGKAVRSICGLQLIYTSNMYSPPGSLPEVLGRIRAVVGLAASCYMGMWYLPSSTEQGQLYVHSALVALSLGAVVIGILKVKKSVLLKLVAMAVLFFVVSAPFILRFLTIVMPPRSCILVAFSLVIVLFLAWRCLRNNRFFRYVYLALLSVVSIHYLLVVNRLAYASKMQSDRDCEVVRRVVERLEANPSFYPYTRSAKGCPFIMVGAPYFGRDGGGPFGIQSDTAGRSILDWEGGHPDRFEHLTRFLTRRVLVRPDKTTIQKLSAVIDDLPLWPLPGSVVMTNGVAIAKFAGDFSPIQLRCYHLAEDRRLLFFPRRPGLSEGKAPKTPPSTAKIFSFADSCVKKVAFGEYKGDGVFASTGADFRFYTDPIKADANKRYVVDVCYTVESKRAVSSKTEIFYRDSSISWNRGIGEISFIKNKRGENRFAVIMPGRLMQGGLRFDLSETAGETIRIGHIDIFEDVK